MKTNAKFISGGPGRTRTSNQTVMARRARTRTSQWDIFDWTSWAGRACMRYGHDR